MLTHFPFYFCQRKRERERERKREREREIGMNRKSERGDICKKVTRNYIINSRNKPVVQQPILVLAPLLLR